MCAKSEEKIACPHCQWEPDGGQYWRCDCGFVWDTFSTGAICPACQKRHKYTMCPTCSKVSLHIDWYHNPIDLEIETLLEEVVVVPKTTRR
ncbi:MAG TPA: hypothetical protein DCM08_03485 [Microscillaceae bacterium]|jgi:Zn ribbon nucleic-acid-binding protein|nr:hypothetical protein [Microscillaceae bacterium]